MALRRFPALRKELPVSLLNTDLDSASGEDTCRLVVLDIINLFDLRASLLYFLPTRYCVLTCEVRYLLRLAWRRCPFSISAVERRVWNVGVFSYDALIVIGN